MGSVSSPVTAGGPLTHNSCLRSPLGTDPIARGGTRSENRTHLGIPENFDQVSRDAKDAKTAQTARELGEA